MPKARIQQLKDSHEKKLMDLYESYYQKALEGDNNSFKPFIEVSKELFGEKEDDSVSALLKEIHEGE